MYIPPLLTNFNIDEINKKHSDVVIIGSGIAGVYTALMIPSDYTVTIATKETLEVSNSVLAQGGIAVSLDKGDSPELHFKDTIYAGAGLCDEESVWVLVNEAAKNIEKLCEYGVNFDKKSPNELSLSREAAHSKNRIIHAGDTTGKEVCDKLISEVKKKDNVKILERTFALDLLLNKDGSCEGILVLNEDSKQLEIIYSKVVICATGGFGQVFKNTTNPEVATGDGVCMAYRAGALLQDLEFIQFHPTVLFHPENRNFLISEAVRGEGAILKNIHGERFMPSYHELAELAPRDVVSRAIFAEMKKTNADHVFLDITFKSKDWLKKRFPNIYKTCSGYGIDISRDFIPVAPAEHYCMGGIKTDVYGRTSIKGFYACGEAACNGIHGANRLASNSLLEGLVFGNIIGKDIDEIVKDEGNKAEISPIPPEKREKVNLDIKSVKKAVQELMTDKAGIVRNAAEMQQALEKLVEYIDKLKYAENKTIEDFEVQNIVLLAYLLVSAALKRQESRGAHFREDFPYTDDSQWKKNIIVSKEGYSYE